MNVAKKNAPASSKATARSAAKIARQAKPARRKPAARRGATAPTAATENNPATTIPATVEPEPTSPNPIASIPSASETTVADAPLQATAPDANAALIDEPPVDQPVTEHDPAPTSAPGKNGTARPGTKIATVLALLGQEGGASLPELMAATGWQGHSVRGFLSGTLKKKHGMVIVYATRADGTKAYQVREATA